MCGRTALALPKNMTTVSNSEMIKEAIQNGSQVSTEVATDTPTAPITKKKVHFHGIVQVILIPSIKEYREAEIFNSIWWVASDYREFQLTMSVAFRKFVTSTKCPNLKEALKMFIQDELTNEHEDVKIVPEAGVKRAAEHIAQLCVEEASFLNKRARI